MLVANNLHFEHNCVVLSVNGYPAKIFEPVMYMLRRNPNIKVYALHDASPAGLRLLETLRQPEWFADDDIVIHDLGLLPHHALTIKQPFVRCSSASGQAAQQLPETILQPLSENAYQWLTAGHFLELEALSPKQISQMIGQEIGPVSLVSAAASGEDMYWAR
jgi:hypothetical protein